MYRKFFIACLFVSAMAAARAQGGGTKGGINDGSVVTGVYKPKLIAASKLLIDPTIPKAESQILNVTYNVADYRWNTRKITRILPPVKHFEPGLDTSYNPNYIRLGAGNYFHKLGELYIANRANAKYAYNLAIQHLSADQSKVSEDTKNNLRDFSSNKGYLYGARFFKKSSLGIQVNYLRDMNRYFAKDTIWEKDFVSTFKKISENVGASVLYDLKALEKKPGFQAGIMFNNFFNNLNHSETEIGGKTGWDFVFPKFSTFGSLGVTNLKYRQSFTTTRQWFIDLLPRVKYYNKQNGVDITAGINLTWVIKDTLTPVTYFNPYLYGEKKLEGFKMKVYGGIDGGLRRNSLRRFSEQVPFTYDTLRVLNTYEQLRGYAGLKGRITENSQFSLEFGGNSVSDLPLVVNSGDSIRSLNVVYDDVASLYFAADLRFSIGEKLRVGATGRFTDYTTTNEQKAWHLPAGTYSLSIQYIPVRNLIFQAGVDGMGRRFSRNLANPSLANLSMKAFADAHLRADYRVNNLGRIWVQASNLINQKYQMWNGFYNYGFTILGGIAASF
ncbi:MAG: hypothetical protein JNL57_02835 [Bacteroidetes bacterium]|nr:hypothetical protein [Bacteroidota bacterium]